MRLSLISLIEEGMFVQVFSPEFMKQIYHGDPGIQIVLIGCLTSAVATLYGILVYIPSRSLDLIRMIRQKRHFAWIPGFTLEVICLVFQIIIR